MVDRSDEEAMHGKMHPLFSGNLGGIKLAGDDPEM
jgi:hypothetical protein